MRVSENYSVPCLIEPANYGSLGVDTDSVNMKALNSFATSLMFGALTGDSILKVYLGATKAAKTTAIAFIYRISTADHKLALADQFADGAVVAVASAGLTLTAATFDHRIVIIEVDADAVLEGKPWLTFEISAAATVMNVAAMGVGQSRFRQHAMPTIL